MIGVLWLARGVKPGLWLAASVLSFGFRTNWEAAPVATAFCPLGGCLSIKASIFFPRLDSDWLPLRRPDITFIVDSLDSTIPAYVQDPIDSV